MTSSIALWRDNRGRLSALRIATLALLLCRLRSRSWNARPRLQVRGASGQ